MTHRIGTPRALPVPHEGAGRADVLVVGAGPAGLSAALEAAQQGAEVLVVESAGHVGGAARGGGGGTLVAGSPLQQRQGVADSPDQALADWFAWGGAEVDQEWARRYVERGVADVYQWLERLGVRWERLVQHEGSRVPRWHAPRGAGRAVTARLEEAVRSEPRVHVRLGTPVTDLTTSGGSVAGVTVRTPDGRSEDLAATVTVLASGGFCNDWALVRAHAPVPASARILLGGADGARGAGHRMLAPLTPDLVGLDRVWMYPYATPDPDDPAGQRGLALRGIEADVWVTQAGARFHDESRRGGASGTVALLGVPAATCWSVFDARVAATLRVADAAYDRGDGLDEERRRRLLDDSPFITIAASLRELGARAGIDGAQLAATVAAHNRARTTGEAHDELGRPLHGLRPLTESPFFAVQLFPLARKNLGGARTDLDGQVLTAAGQAIPGLFAAGEVAGMAGGHINGRAALEGTMLGPSLYSGRIAGRRAGA